MNSREEVVVKCPICGKCYPSNEVEEHANRCIFLNSESPTTSTKRSQNRESNGVVKRSKLEVCENSEGIEEPTEVHSASNGFSRYATDEDNTSPCVLSGSAPLAEQMRPSQLSHFVGQEHVLGHNKALRNLIESQEIPSMILWGPPGCGKTTLAHIIAKQSKSRSQQMRFVKLSATMAGVNDVKEVVKIAKNELTAFKRKTILFMDEIHRFNKLQQDIFLPHIESGVIVLIGATTENPSFSLNSALLSRCRVIVLEKLEVQSLHTILTRATKAIGAAVVTNIKKIPKNLKESRLLIEEATLQWLAEICDGDARIALNSLQMAVQSQETRPDRDTQQPNLITLDSIKEGVKKSHLLYDKKGEEHYNTISALHKSIRASDDNAALYWLARMLEGGEDPLFIARRMVRAASEDIGLADPIASTMAVAAMQGCQLIGKPECDVILAQCAVYLARAPKSTAVYKALEKAKQFIRDHKGPLPGVPLHLRNAPTRLMKELGYGKGYCVDPSKVPDMKYLPEGMEKVNFFQK